MCNYVVHHLWWKGRRVCTWRSDPGEILQHCYWSLSSADDAICNPDFSVFVEAFLLPASNGTAMKEADRSDEYLKIRNVLRTYAVGTTASQINSY